MCDHNQLLPCLYQQLLSVDPTKQKLDAANKIIIERKVGTLLIGCSNEILFNILFFIINYACKSKMQLHG